MLRSSKRKKKGQALAELAIFGTVLLGVFGFLLNYGLNYNYSENVQMVSFRQALAKAYEARATYNTGNVVIVRDKPIPDPSSPFGISSRFPVVSSASAVWSNDLMLSWGRGDFGSRDMLPKITFLVGEKEYNFTVAGWASKIFEDLGEIKEKKDDPGDNHDMNGNSCSAPCDGRYWYWKTVPISAVAANNDYDVDGDDKLETVISKARGELRYLDYQEGEIDSSINTKDMREGDFPASGFTGEYEQKKNLSNAGWPNTKLTRGEDRTNIVTTEEINTEDDFYHLIRLNKNIDITGDVRSQLKDGDRIDDTNKFFWVNAKFSQQITRRWTTPK